MNNTIFSRTLIAVAMVFSMGAGAEDIDLFMGPVSTGDISPPNILFVIDNTGNWTAPFEDEKKAFRAVFDAIADLVTDEENPKKLNVGIMMFSETGADDDTVSGAYVRAAVRPMGEKIPAGLSDDPDDEVYADLYGKLISGFHERDDKANAGAAGLTMAEAYYYFAGMRPYAGNNKAKTDWGGDIDPEGVSSIRHNEYMNSNDTCCVESHPVWKLPKNALTRKDSTKYQSPIEPGTCGGNYIIWISNGPTQDPKAGGSDPIPKQLLASVGGSTKQYSLNPSGSADTWSDEWAKFMYDSPENIVTFTVDVLPSDKGQGPGWTELLRNMAKVGGGDYAKVTNPDSVETDLTKIIAGTVAKILSENSVFASVALPASSNSQSTFLNQVFIGQFRPDASRLPQWPGNLKQYRLSLVDNVLKVVDSKGRPIVDNVNGFITACAESYWSESDDYWSGYLALKLESFQVCKEDSTDSTFSNSPDGPVVEKGAQAQRLRALSDPASRKVYTCDPDIDTCSTTATMPEFKVKESTTDFDFTADMFGVAEEDLEDTINWARGADIDDEDQGEPEDPPEMRSSAHGDVIHSRPVALNYGTDSDPQIVVFYSGNDGMLRAINGNRTDISPRDDNGVTPGDELWSFIPPEFFGHIDTLRRPGATDIINFPASSADAPTDGISKPYGIDGPITAFSGFVPDAGTSGDDRKYLYAGMRRAGRVVYAFDVTNSKSPKMLWKKGCSNPDADGAVSCTAGWEDIGQTWSQPNVVFARGYADATSNKLKPMLMMGGGYDPCEDQDNNTNNHACPADPESGDGDQIMGNIIYILDAYNGNILKTFYTDRGVAGGITVVPYSKNDPAARFAYAVDMGGNIYRIHGGTLAAPAAIDATPPDSWQITKIASLGCDTASAGCAANRKFLFGPDVVESPKNTGQIAVLVGSGDREKPLVNYGAALGLQNYFFSVFDNPTDASWLTDEDDADGKAICGADIICLSALTPVTTDGVARGTQLSGKGWRLALDPGEQVVTGAITVADIANFSTHIPAQPDEACTTNLGTATTYSIDYQDAEGSKVVVRKGGLVPTPVAGMVILDDGKKVPFCIGCGGEDSAIGAKLVGTGVKWKQPKSRVYWNIQQ